MKENIKNEGAHYYAVRAVDNRSGFGRNMVLKGAVVPDGENGGRRFVKTLYEIKPAYFVSRTK